MNIGSLEDRMLAVEGSRVAVENDDLQPVPPQWLLHLSDTLGVVLSPATYPTL